MADYHLSPKEEIQFICRRATTSRVLIPGRTTQSDYSIEVRKREKKDYEILGTVQRGGRTAPIYVTGGQSDTTAIFEIPWFPPSR